MKKIKILILFFITTSTVFAQETKTYYNSGELYEKGKLNKGKREGKWLSYHKNGKVKATKLYKKGEVDGKWIYYYPSGEIEFIENYKKGEYHGMHIVYFKDGKIKGSVNYVNDLEDGEVFLMLDKKKFKFKGTYKKGKQVGKWIRNKYDKDSNLIKSQEYLDGKLHGNVEFYKKHSALLEKGTYKNGKKEGLWVTYFDEVNAVKSKVNFQNGIKYGKAKYYKLKRNTSYLLREGNYKNNREDGSWITYDPENYDLIYSIYYYEDGVLKNSKKPLELYAKNNSSELVRFFIKVRNRYNKWESLGWFNLKAGEDGFLTKILGDDFLLYAKSESSEWSGNEPKVFKGKQYPMKRLTKVGFLGKYTLKFSN